VVLQEVLAVVQKLAVLLVAQEMVVVVPEVVLAVLLHLPGANMLPNTTCSNCAIDGKVSALLLATRPTAYATSFCYTAIVHTLGIPYLLQPARC
jgi:hypothetical protein